MRFILWAVTAEGTIEEHLYQLRQSGQLKGTKSKRYP